MEAPSAGSVGNSTEAGSLQTIGSCWSRFKLMLVHDGLQQLDRAISDLQRHNFPANSEILVLSVADLFRTPLHLVGRDIAQADHRRALPSHLRPRHKKTQLFFHALHSIQHEAYAKLQTAFPLWEISFERSLGWEPNLIYLGIFKQSTINPGLSEIIRKILTESHIPLIMARPQPHNQATHRPAIIAFDAPASAAALLRTLQQRPAEEGRDIYLVLYKDSLMAHAKRWSVGYEEPDREWMDSQLIRTKSAIEALGYAVNCETVVGNTAQAILNLAKRVDAENIIIGTGRLAHLGSLSVQTIPVTVAADAACSVEIVLSAETPQASPALHAFVDSKAVNTWKIRNDSGAGMASPM